MGNVIFPPEWNSQHYELKEDLSDFPDEEHVKNILDLLRSDDQKVWSPAIKQIRQRPDLMQYWVRGLLEEYFLNRVQKPSADMMQSFNNYRSGGQTPQDQSDDYIITFQGELKQTSGRSIIFQYLRMLHNEKLDTRVTHLSKPVLKLVIKNSPADVIPSNLEKPNLLSVN